MSIRSYVTDLTGLRLGNALTAVLFLASRIYGKHSIQKNVNSNGNTMLLRFVSILNKICKTLTDFFSWTQWHKLSGIDIGKNTVIERYVSFKGKRVKIGDNCLIEAFTCFKCLNLTRSNLRYNVTIGNNVFIGRGNIFDSNLSVSIGSNTSIAPNCFITDSSHNFADTNIPISAQGGNFKDVVIDENV
jgi:acetyltransferase-like isoleucine patch superfamily enzyme